MEKPVCCVKGCENPAFICVYDEWYCGECMHKLHNNNKKFLQESLKSKIRGD